MATVASALGGVRRTHSPCSSVYSRPGSILIPMVTRPPQDKKRV